MSPKAPRFSIVAPGSDYGKTRLITGIVAELSKLGVRACVVKHSANASPPDSGKDTHLFRESGAKASALVDASGMASIYLPGEGLEGAIDAMAHLNPDVVICEGFKDSNVQKILIARSEDDLALASTLKGVVAVASVSMLSSPGVAALMLDPVEVAQFIIRQLSMHGSGVP